MSHEKRGGGRRERLSTFQRENSGKNVRGAPGNRIYLTKKLKFLYPEWIVPLSGVGCPSNKEQRGFISQKTTTHNLLPDQVPYKCVGSQPTASPETLAADLGESTPHSLSKEQGLFLCLHYPFSIPLERILFHFERNIFLFHWSKAFLHILCKNNFTQKREG